MAGERGVFARAPGRVNLIGDHTDYTGGLVLPMAIDFDTAVRGRTIREPVVRLRSKHFDGEAVIRLDEADPSGVDPPWARYVAGVVHELRPADGFEGEITSTVPIGAGLSSSAALQVALTFALGVTDPLAVARLCQRAEFIATGVPCGIMDQLTSTSGIAGYALLIDCHSLDVVPVPMPDDLDVVVVHSGEQRTLADTAYSQRVAECAAAEELIGALRQSSAADLARIDDPVVRARARHVISETLRVRDFAAALTAGDLRTAGELMTASHASLRYDYEVSTPALDALVDRLTAKPGVHGARVTGAGFGGCVVALCERGVLREGRRVRPSGGASVAFDG
ncbi:MAG: galactokinase [Acidimicrobiales bacterium]